MPARHHDVPAHWINILRQPHAFSVAHSHHDVHVVQPLRGHTLQVQAQCTSTQPNRKTRPKPHSHTANTATQPQLHSYTATQLHTHTQPMPRTFHGGSPTAISNSVTPKLNTSLASLYWWYRSASGAMLLMGPIVDDVYPLLMFAALRREKPKSATRTEKNSSTRMFCVHGIVAPGTTR